MSITVHFDPSQGRYIVRLLSKYGSVPIGRYASPAAAQRRIARLCAAGHTIDDQERDKLALASFTTQAAAQDRPA